MLTRKQSDLLQFIERHLADHGIAPSFEEMKEAVNLQSKSGIHRLINGLEERGFIRRLPHRARALEVIRPQENQKPLLSNAINSQMIDIPIMGRIAAGTPIEALSGHGEYLPMPSGFVGKDDNVYALEVAGDSMIDAGILDGDTVLIRHGNTAQNGDIVVALVDDFEVTLKYLHHRADKITLEPANRQYEPRILDAGRVKVQGRLVGLIRHY